MNTGNATINGTIDATMSVTINATIHVTIDVTIIVTNYRCDYPCDYQCDYRRPTTSWQYGYVKPRGAGTWERATLQVPGALGMYMLVHVWQVGPLCACRYLVAGFPEVWSGGLIASCSYDDKLELYVHAEIRGVGFLRVWSGALVFWRSSLGCWFSGGLIWQLAFWCLIWGVGLLEVPPRCLVLIADQVDKACPSEQQAADSSETYNFEGAPNLSLSL